MAEIQMVYMRFRCKYNSEYLNTQCFTEAAGDTGCYNFHHPEPYRDADGILVYPIFRCLHAYVEYKYKGVTAKSYEMEEIDDPECAYSWIDIKIGKQKYACAKVTLDGRCIYNVYDDEEVKGSIS